MSEMVERLLEDVDDIENQLTDEEKRKYGSTRDLQARSQALSPPLPSKVSPSSFPGQFHFPVSI